MRRLYYLLSLIFVFCIPVAGAYWFLKNYIDLQALIPFIVLITLMGSIWDIWATKHGKEDRVWLWQFNHRDTLGIRIWGVPVEEYLFYVVASTYAIFMWEGMKMIRGEGVVEAYLLVGAMALWTIVAIATPYLFAPKGDRFIN